jgi:hypothetical protein
MCPAFVIFVIWLNPGYDLSWMPFNTERWALGAFGWIFSGAIAVNLSALSVAWVWGFLSRWNQSPGAQR